jgi:hypothetical protein
MSHSYRTSAIPRLLVSLVACTAAAFAQPSPAGENSDPLHRRFSFGVRGGGLPLRGMTNLSQDISTTTPAENINNFSRSAAKRYTFGPTVHFSITERLGINVDFLYRRTGYDSGSTRHVRNEDGSSGQFLSAAYERTRADFWDIPVMARFYNQGPEDDGPRFFVAGGPALRNVTGIKTFSERFDERRLRDTDTVPIRPAHQRVAGATVGGGLQLRDEVGLKVELEGRFTRWFERIFETNINRMNLQQVEVLVSFTF